MKKLIRAVAVAVAAFLSCCAVFAQNSANDEAGRILGLENAWGHAIEAKDTKALDMLLGSTFVAVEIDGIFRVKGTEKGKPYVHRERFIDTWIKQNQTWQCVASSATLIPAK